MAITFSSQPTAQNKLTGENWTLGASVTGEATTTFTNKPLPVTTLELCPWLHLTDAGTIYTGSGSTAAADARTYYSSNNADTWSTLHSAIANSTTVYSMIETLSGDILTTVGIIVGTTGLVHVLRNGVQVTTVTATSSANASSSYVLHQFPNGNIVLGTGDVTNGGGKIFLSSNNGSSFSLVLTGNNPASGQIGRMHSQLVLSSTEMLISDLSGYVYRTTNSGSSWSQVSRVGTNTGNYAMGILGSRIICNDSIASAWFQSTDNGSTWQSYVGTPPPFNVFNKIRTFDGITFIGTLAGESIAANKNDTSWSTYALPDVAITRVYDILLKEGYVYASTGGPSDYGRVYRAPLTTVFGLYKSPSTLIDSSTETDGTFSYTDVADASDVGDYYITATNAGTTTTSNTVAVAVSDHLAVAGITGGGDYEEGETAIIWVTHTGGKPPVSVAWYKNTILIVGKTGDSLVIQNATTSDSGSYYAIVSSLDESVQSDTVVVNVASAQIIFPMSGHSCEVAMAWEVNKGHNDNFNVYDYGSAYDTYTAEVEYLSDTPYFYNRQAENVAVQVTDHAGGFYPFGSHLLNDVNGFRYAEFKGKINYFATYYSWDCQLVPAKDSVYTTVPYTFTACSVTGFTFGTLVNFPLPEAEPVDEYAKKWNRQTNSFAEYDFGETTEARAVKLKWKDLKNDDFAVLMSYILTGVRATQISATFPRIVSPWKLRDGEDFGSFNIRISNPKIKYKQSSGNLWDVSLEVRKCQ